MRGVARATSTHGELRALVADAVAPSCGHTRSAPASDVTRRIGVATSVAVRVRRRCRWRSVVAACGRGRRTEDRTWLSCSARPSASVAARAARSARARRSAARYRRAARCGTAEPATAARRACIQPRLSVGAGDDPFEHEAERTADAVLSRTARRAASVLGGAPRCRVASCGWSNARWARRDADEKDDDEKKKPEQRKRRRPARPRIDVGVPPASNRASRR